MILRPSNQKETKLQNPKSPRLVTLEQVKLHHTPDDLWMIIYNRVYDITSFSKDHPGGVEVLYDCGGADATQAFEDVGHSDQAFTMLGPYLVGEVHPEQQKSFLKIRSSDPYASTVAKVEAVQQRTRGKGRKQGGEWVWFILLAFMALACLVLYIYIQRFKWVAEE